MVMTTMLSTMRPTILPTSLFITRFPFTTLFTMMSTTPLWFTMTSLSTIPRQHTTLLLGMLNQPMGLHWRKYLVFILPIIQLQNLLTMLQNLPTMLQNQPTMLQNQPTMLQNLPTMLQNQPTMLQLQNTTEVWTQCLVSAQNPT